MIGAIGAALSIGSGLVQAGGSLLAGNAAAASAEYQAQAAEENARWSRLMGDVEVNLLKQATQWELYKHGLAVSRMEGAQRTAYAKAGVATTGSPLSVSASSAGIAAADAAIIRYQGDVDVATARLRALAEARGYRESATLARMGGAQAKAAGQIGAVSGLLSGATGAAGLLGKKPANNTEDK